MTTQLVTVYADGTAWEKAEGSTQDGISISSGEWTNYTSYKSYNDQYWILRRQKMIGGYGYVFAEKDSGGKPTDDLKRMSAIQVSETIYDESKGEYKTGVDSLQWDWNLAGSIGTSLKEESAIWDGKTNPYYDNYLDGKTADYLCATWKLSSTRKSDLRRFRGTFTLPADFNPADTIQYRSVNQDRYANINGGDIIPINDDIFIFVYPQDVKITNSNYLDYLAFWSGSSYQYGSTFHTIPSEEAIHLKSSDPNYKTLKLTDGWYVKASPDNIGKAMFKDQTPQPNQTYVIDIFTSDYAGGGGMDQPEIRLVRDAAYRLAASDDSYSADVRNPAALDILQNDQVYSRDSQQALPELHSQIGARNITAAGDTSLTKSNGGYTVKVDGKTAGTLQIGTDGKGTFTAAEGFTGDVRFTYDAVFQKDGKTYTDEATVTIHVVDYSRVNDIDLSKTAQLIDGSTAWDDRLYDITLHADAGDTSSGGMPAPPRDIALVLDRSGSMAYGKDNESKSDPVRIGAFGSVKDTLVTTRQYYYYVSDDGAYISYNNSYSEPDANRLAYRNGMWMKYVKPRGSSSYTWTKMGDSDVIYNRNDRLCQLKESVDRFIDMVAEQSPQSRLSVIYFASDAEDATAGTWLTLDSQANLQKLKAAVGGVRAGGGTYLGEGLQAAGSTYFTQQASPTNVRTVISFTDGAYNGDPSGSASTLKTQKKAEIFCVGLYLSDSAVRNLRNNVASPDEAGGIPHVLNAADAGQLSTLFEAIAGEVAKPVNGVTVTDTLDARFELAEGERARLKADGATITDNADGTTTITWSDQTVGTEDKAWTRTFRVRAKDSFIGGNYVPTNVKESSGVSGDGVTKPFPQPFVNVKIAFTLTDTRETVFLGESAPAPSQVESRMKASADGIVYQWSGGIDPTVAVTPEKAGDIVFTLTGTIPGGPVNGTATANTRGHANPANVTQSATYTVHTLDGTLIITKKLTADTPADPVTPFVFRIDRYADAARTKCVETFTRTVYTANDRQGSVTITGLPKGYYTVTEETDWSWRYEPTGAAKLTGTLGTAAGYSDKTLRVTFENQKTTDQWLSASDSVVNLFR